MSSAGTASQRNSRSASPSDRQMGGRPRAARLQHRPHIGWPSVGLTRLLRPDGAPAVSCRVPVAAEPITLSFRALSRRPVWESTLPAAASTVMLWRLSRLGGHRQRRRHPRRWGEPSGEPSVAAVKNSAAKGSTERRCRERQAWRLRSRRSRIDGWWHASRSALTHRAPSCPCRRPRQA